MPHTGRNRSAADGGPQGVQRSYASALKEREALFHSYEHLQGLPRGDVALTMLRKIASQVKPIMRKRGWRVQVLAEFLPPEQNLLGLNINKGHKICVRLRFHHNPDLFLPIEQVVDTMLHELSHIVWGDHDSNFHRLWDQLRDEWEILIRRGFTGEGFLSEGHSLGGQGLIPPPDEMRRLARESAEKRKAQGTLAAGSGRRVGGTPLHLFGGDIRNTIVNQVTRRNAIDKGCASGRDDAVKLSQVSSITSFKTKAEEDDANNRAIAQALYELMQEEEEQKLRGAFSAPPSDGGLGWHPDRGLYDPAMSTPQQSPLNAVFSPLTEQEQLRLAMEASMKDQANVSPEQNFPSPMSASNRRRSAASSPPIRPIRHDPFPVMRKPPPSTVASSSSQLPAARSVHPSTSPPRPPPNKIKRKRLAEPSNLPTSGEATVSRASLDTIPIIDLSEPFNPDEWTCGVCTCINPTRFLACDACGSERPQNRRAPAPAPPVIPRQELSSDPFVNPAAASRRSHTHANSHSGSGIGLGLGSGDGSGRASSTAWHVHPALRPQLDSIGWNCTECGSFMEHRWWTCSACGTMKASS